MAAASAKLSLFATCNTSDGLCLSAAATIIITLVAMASVRLPCVLDIRLWHQICRLSVGTCSVLFERSIMLRMWNLSQLFSREQHVLVSRLQKWALAEIFPDREGVGKHISSTVDHF